MFHWSSLHCNKILHHFHTLIIANSSGSNYMAPDYHTIWCWISNLHPRVSVGLFVLMMMRSASYSTGDTYFHGFVTVAQHKYEYDTSGKSARSHWDSFCWWWDILPSFPKVGRWGRGGHLGVGGVGMGYLWHTVGMKAQFCLEATSKYEASND